MLMITSDCSITEKADRELGNRGIRMIILAPANPLYHLKIGQSGTLSPHSRKDPAPPMKYSCQNMGNLPVLA